MDKISIGLLELYSQRGSLNLSQLSTILDTNVNALVAPINYLRNKGLLKVNANDPNAQNVTSNSAISLHTSLIITYEGRVVLEAAHKASKAKKIEWIRYGITTAIALAGFIKSFFF